MPFPKQLTVRLPELQRESLQEILKREPDHNPAQRVERLLAVGICRKIRGYRDIEDHAWSGPPAGAPTPMKLRIELRPDQGERLHRAMRDRSQLSPEEFALRLLDWSLDAYGEELRIVDETHKQAKGGA
jgi:hypothetical protein